MPELECAYPVTAAVEHLARGVEGEDRLPGVEGEADTAQVDLDVRFAVGLCGDLEALLPCESVFCLV